MASSFQRQVVQRVEAVNAPPNRHWNLKLVWQKLDPALSTLAMDLVKSILQSPKPSPLVLHGVVDLAKLLEIVRLPTGDRLAERLAKALQGTDDQGPGNAEAPRGAFSLQQGQVKAPRGGISVRGKFYRGGEFIPGDVVSAAAVQDRRQLFERVQEDAEEDARDKAAPPPEPDPAENEPNRPDPRDKVKKTTVQTEGDRVDLTFWDGWSWWANSLSRHTVGTIDPRDGNINANVGGKVFVLDPNELKAAVANHEIRSREDFEVWAATHCVYDLRSEQDRKLWETVWKAELQPGSMSAASDPLRQVLDQAKDAGPAVQQMLDETLERVLRRNLAPVDAAMSLYEAAKFAREHGKESAAAALVALGTYLIYRKVSGALKLRKIQREQAGAAAMQGTVRPAVSKEQPPNSARAASQPKESAGANAAQAAEQPHGEQQPLKFRDREPSAHEPNAPPRTAIDVAEGVSSSKPWKQSNYAAYKQQIESALQKRGVTTKVEFVDPKAYNLLILNANGKPVAARAQFRVNADGTSTILLPQGYASSHLALHEQCHALHYADLIKREKGDLNKAQFAWSQITQPQKELYVYNELLKMSNKGTHTLAAKDLKKAFDYVVQKINSESTGAAREKYLKLAEGVRDGTIHPLDLFVELGL